MCAANEEIVIWQSRFSRVRNFLAALFLTLAFINILLKPIHEYEWDSFIMLVIIGLLIFNSFNPKPKCLILPRHLVYRRFLGFSLKLSWGHITSWRFRNLGSARQFGQVATLNITMKNNRTYRFFISTFSDNDVKSLRTALEDHCPKKNAL